MAKTKRFATFAPYALACLTWVRCRRDARCHPYACRFHGVVPPSILALRPVLLGMRAARRHDMPRIRRSCHPCPDHALRPMHQRNVNTALRTCLLTSVLSILPAMQPFLQQNAAR